MVIPFIPPHWYQTYFSLISFLEKILLCSRLNYARHYLGFDLWMPINTWCDDSCASTTRIKIQVQQELVKKYQKHPTSGSCPDTGNPSESTISLGVQARWRVQESYSMVRMDYQCFYSALSSMLSKNCLIIHCF